MSRVIVLGALVFPIVPDFERYPQYGRDLNGTFGEIGLAGHWIKVLRSLIPEDVRPVAAYPLRSHQPEDATPDLAWPSPMTPRKDRAMNLSPHRIVVAAVCVIGLLGQGDVLAQAGQGQGRGGGTPYDTKTEATFTGAVDAVENVTPPGKGRRNLGGTHIRLRTEKETVEVHLGPTAFLRDQQAEIAKGDAVDILGSRVVVDGESVVLAREIKKGGRTWMLRDASGRPAWAGRGGRQ